MEFMDAVRNRRSVRRFLPREVPEAALNDILDAARHAPSSGGYNSSHFGVIRDKSLRMALAAVSGGQDWIATAPVIIALCSQLSTDPATRAADDPYFEINAARFGKDLIGYLNAYPDRHAMRVFSDTAFPMIPGEHVALAATAHGLASCWIGHLDTTKASEILGLPEDVVCLYLIPIGYADETPAEKALRPMSECVFADRWAAST